MEISVFPQFFRKESRMVFHFRPNRAVTCLKLYRRAEKQFRKPNQPGSAGQNWWKTRDVDIAKSGKFGKSLKFEFLTLVHFAFLWLMRPVRYPKQRVWTQNQPKPVPESVQDTKKNRNTDISKFEILMFWSSFWFIFLTFPYHLVVDGDANSKFDRKCFISVYITSDFFSDEVQTFLYPKNTKKRKVKKVRILPNWIPDLVRVSADLLERKLWLKWFN